MRSEAEAKQYDIAKSYAAEVVAASEKAINDGKAGALRAAQEAANLVGTLKDSLGQTQDALDRARSAEDIDLDFEGLDRDLDSARRNTEEAESATAANNSAEALEKGRNAQGTLGDIMTGLSDGVRAGGRKK
jgi:capsule polysaccharide export protein KpsE/RkpR